MEPRGLASILGLSCSQIVHPPSKHFTPNPQRSRQQGEIHREVPQGMLGCSIRNLVGEIPDQYCGDWGRRQGPHQPKPSRRLQNLLWPPASAAAVEMKRGKKKPVFDRTRPLSHPVTESTTCFSETEEYLRVSWAASAWDAHSCQVGWMEVFW